VSDPLNVVTFEPSGARADVPAGTVLREAAADAGADLDAPCGGLGTCGRCAVLASGSLEPPEADEIVLLSPARLAAGERLACRARVAGDVTVHVRTAASAAPPAVGSADVAPIVEPPERRGIVGPGPVLGAVVDIGTTTVAVTVVDLRSAAVVGAASAFNPQRQFGHDVMSRISHAASHGVESLRGPIVRAIEDLVLDILGASDRGSEDVREMAVCGNTTMVHLLLGIDPAPLGTSPYAPAFVSALERPARELGFSRLPHAGAYVLPGASAFVGSDITAGVLAMRLDELAGPALLLDLGTNGEIVLRTPDGLVAASTAAGPALEAASITYGMVAEDGAIERVDLVGGALKFGTVGDTTPRGLCGSGLLDLIAALLDAGVLDETGRLRDDADHALSACVLDADGIRVFEVAPGVLLTQLDVRQVQLAKAAIASGLDLLLESAGIAADDVDEVFCAGGFGYHVRPDALVRIGMVPPSWRGRMRAVGNTAQAGALLALLDSGARRRAEAVARHVTTIDLASCPDFEGRFVGAMDFPLGG
jgi:uncharacterized 2Fe-2S/4Fe-4S cluster protein (DUF4445 family)